MLGERITWASDVLVPDGLPQLEQKRAESELTVPQLEQIMVGEPHTIVVGRSHLFRVVHFQIFLSRNQTARTIVCQASIDWTEQEYQRAAETNVNRNGLRTAPQSEQKRAFSECLAVQLGQFISIHRSFDIHFSVS